MTATVLQSQPLPNSALTLSTTADFLMSQRTHPSVSGQYSAEIIMRLNEPWSKVAMLAKKYPSSTGELIQIYNDLYLAQRWRDVVAVDLCAAQRPALLGTRVENVGTSLLVSGWNNHQNRKTEMQITPAWLSLVVYRSHSRWKGRYRPSVSIEDFDPDRWPCR